MRLKSRTASLLIYLPAAALLGILRLLPRKGILALGRSCGRIVFRMDRKRRQLAAANLTTAFGTSLSEKEKTAIIRRAFLHFGMVFFDFFHLAYLPPAKRDRHIRLEGEENLRKALNQGQGVLLFTAHYGLWEIAPSPINPIIPIKVVARPLDNMYLERTLLQLRSRLGSEVISKFQASREILKALRARESVAILIDQNVLAQEAVFVDFFGKPAATTPSLAMFHLRTEAPIVPVFSSLSSSRIYHVRILPPVEVKRTGDRDTDVALITQACTRIIEDQIRQAPEYWFWFHDRWKTRPG
jgi:KDO2-lipid IV(A) lauroyltransferase